MKTALLIVDIQNDFLPGGSLAVTGGDDVIPLINQLVIRDFDLIIASKDWHPFDHRSFADTHQLKPGEIILLDGVEQVLWPRHCVQNTRGAEFSTELDASHFKQVFLKGTNKNIDSYSAFFDNGHYQSTGLGEYLKHKEISEIYFAGLTTDYCIKYSVLDAIKLGFKCNVVIDACRPVNLQLEDEQKAIEEMRKAGAKIITLKQVLI